MKKVSPSFAQKPRGFPPGASLFLFLFLLLQSQLTSLEHTSKFRNWYNTNYITDIISVNGKLAIGSSKGFVIFTPKVNNFVTLNKSDGLIDNQVNGLVSDNKNIFLFTSSGIAIISVDTTTIRNISSIIHFQGEPKTGLLKGDTLFWGTSEYLYVWDTEGDPFNQFNMSWTPYSFRHYGINTLFLMNDTLYCGTDGGGVCMVPDYSFLDTTQWVWNTTAEGLPNDTATTITFWGGEFWIGTKDGIISGTMNNWTPRNAGLDSSAREINELYSGETLWVATENCPRYWNDSLSRWIRIDSGLNIKRIRGICSDNTGRLWIGIDGDGIAYLEDTLWNIIGIPGPSSSNFSDITIDKDSGIWGVHYQQKGKTISHFHNGNWEILNDTNELGIAGSIRWVDVDKQNNKWLGLWSSGAGNNIIKLSENGEWDSLTLPVSGVVGSQFIDSKGNKWFSNFKSSVCKLLPDDSTWQVYDNENYLDHIVAFAEDTLVGNIYFGSTLRGISVLKADGTWLKIGGLPSEQVYDLAFDRKGDLWVGSAAGAVVIRDFSVIKHYTSTTSGLMGDNINDILIDWKGNKWFLVDSRGVSVLRYNGEWDSLTVNDGLASDFIMDDLDGLAYDIEKGYLWIATKNGISRYETGLIPPPTDTTLTDIDVYPNPFIPKEHLFVTFNRLPVDVKIYIYSISLKKMKTVEDIDNVTHTAFWDGRDENGNLVDSGIYIFLIVREGGIKKTGKIAVIR
ncbi:MAG: hypothetical protein E3J87_07235 [Candidatus Cloacimonadota bacterium]|nr:MAG: hypothetical protein E3J87_07235 [Candidatus Cloacimonadota bacterium]